MDHFPYSKKWNAFWHSIFYSLVTCFYKFGSKFCRYFQFCNFFNFRNPSPSPKFLSRPAPHTSFLESHTLSYRSKHRRPVCRYNAGSRIRICHNIFQHFPFRRHIERRSCFIQQQNRRFSKQCTRNRKPLCLSF